MKNIIQYTFIGLMTLLMSSCGKDYLDTFPTNNVAPQTVFNDLSGAWAAIEGMHRYTYSTGLNNDQSGISTLTHNFDCMGEDVIYPNAGNNWYITSIRWRNHRSLTAGTNIYLYRFPYELANNANKVLENIDAIVTSDAQEEAQKGAIKGQALTYRAWAHYMLVQVYGNRYDANNKPNNQHGIPLQINSSNEKRARSSVEATYKFINDDLDEAILLLEKDGAIRNNKSHLNIWVALGLKARVALTMQDYDTAAEYADKAIVSATTKGGIRLMNNVDYKKGFTSQDNPEWMWGILQKSDQGSGFASFYCYMSCNYSSTNIRATPKLINKALYDKISKSDVRSELWKDPNVLLNDFVKGVPLPSNWNAFSIMNFMTRKHYVQDPNISSGDQVFMRLSEMYLIKSEALARLGGRDNAAAEALYTLVVERDANYTQSTNTGQGLIDEIMFQRRIELWGEGFRWLDLKRLNIDLDRRGTNAVESVASEMYIPAGDIRWTALIPKRELDQNDLIIQND